LQDDERKTMFDGGCAVASLSQRFTTLHNAPQRSTTLLNAPQRFTTLHNAPQRSTTLLNACVVCFFLPPPQHHTAHQHCSADEAPSDTGEETKAGQARFDIG
jgi:hypothetical protein